MDEVKLDTHLFDSMHFIDYPYQIGGSFEAPNPETMNGINALTEALKSLIFAPQNDKKIRLWSKAFSLLLFVHVFGDLHQPLHAVSLFSEEFTPPLGDMGGNKWRINYTSEVNNQTFTQLHLLYDCVGGLWCTYMPHPVTSDFEKEIKKYADDIIATNPTSSFQKTDLNVTFTTETEFKDIMSNWAHDSFELAKITYDTYKLDSTIQHKEMQWARTLLKKQIALAGYRMAAILQKIDTAIYSSPQRSNIPEYWRTLSIISIALCVFAFILAFLFIRKYKDYKQLAIAKNQQNINDDSNYALLANHE